MSNVKRIEQLIDEISNIIRDESQEIGFFACVYVKPDASTTMVRVGGEADDINAMALNVAFMSNLQHALEKHVVSSGRKQTE